MNLALRPQSHRCFRFLLPKTPKCLFFTFPQTAAVYAFSSAFFSTKTTSKSMQLNYALSLISTLKDCSSNSSVSRGQQYHCHIIKSGLDYNSFIKNSLITFYAKCHLISSARYLFDECGKYDLVSSNILISGYVKSGYLNDAREMFDKMPERDNVSYTTMILGCAQNGFGDEAIEVFQEMRTSGLVPNDVTVSSVISAYLCLGIVTVEIGRMLHGLSLKFGVEDFIHVRTNLLHLYCLGSCLRDARMLFNEMPERTIVSWNMMLNGYTKAGLLDLAMDTFERIEDKDAVSWRTIIGGYFQVGRMTEALALFCQMLRTGLGPGVYLIVSMISACGQTMALTEGQQIHAVAAKKGFNCNDLLQATIIHFYAACGEVNAAYLQFESSSKEHLANWNTLIGGLLRNGMVTEARALFDEMPHRDLFSWSSMIAGYSQNKQPELALEIFHEMVNTGVKANEITMVSVLSAIASLGKLNEGRIAHEYICENSISLNDNLSAALIDMYAKCGSINSACEVFNQIRDKASNISPWNAIICGLAMHGNAELALAILSDLQRRDIDPCPITFIGVLTACCHTGLVEVGENHFMRMKDFYNIEPNVKHYACMADLLSRAGRLEEAEELVRKMPMKANDVIWGILLAASKTHKNTGLGERAAQSLARLEPSHASSRVLLSSIYADSGRFSDAFMVRQVIQDQGLIPRAYSGIA